jgi:hypothetical protein
MQRVPVQQSRRHRRRVHNSRRRACMSRFRAIHRLHRAISDGSTVGRGVRACARACVCVSASTHHGPRASCATACGYDEALLSRWPWGSPFCTGVVDARLPAASHTARPPVLHRSESTLCFPPCVSRAARYPVQAICALAPATHSRTHGYSWVLTNMTGAGDVGRWARSSGVGRRRRGAPPRARLSTQSTQECAGVRAPHQYPYRSR